MHGLTPCLEGKPDSEFTSAQPRCHRQQQTRSPACQQAPCCSAMLLPLDLIMESFMLNSICQGRKKLQFFAYRRLKPSQWKLCSSCEPLPIGANALLSRDDFEPPRSLWSCFWYHSELTVSEEGSWEQASRNFVVFFKEGPSLRIRKLSSPFWWEPGALKGTLWSIFSLPRSSWTSYFLSRPLKVCEHHGLQVWLDHGALAISFQELPPKGQGCHPKLLVWKVQRCEQWILWRTQRVLEASVKFIMLSTHLGCSLWKRQTAACPGPPIRALSCNGGASRSRVVFSLTYLLIVFCLLLVIPRASCKVSWSSVS